MSRIQRTTAHNQSAEARITKPRRLTPTPKTSVPATIVKNEKTKRGSMRSAHRFERNRPIRKIVKRMSKGYATTLTPKSASEHPWQPVIRMAFEMIPVAITIAKEPGSRSATWVFSHSQRPCRSARKRPIQEFGGHASQEL